MPFPASFLTAMTVTGDVVTGPGAPTVIIGALPASCMGDAVVGAVCTGTVVMGSPTVLAMGLPMTRVTSNCVGVSVPLGTPSTTALGLGMPTVLVM